MSFRTQYLKPETQMLAKAIHHTLSILQRHRCSKIQVLHISSELNGYTSKSYGRTDLKTPAKSQPLNESRMPRRQYWCLKSMNSNNVFSVSDFIFQLIVKYLRFVLVFTQKKSSEPGSLISEQTAMLKPDKWIEKAQITEIYFEITHRK